MTIRLIEIGPEGGLAEEEALSELAGSVVEATAAVYRENGFQPPRDGYLGEQEGTVVGAGAFKSPPRQGRVEIAYFTFLGYEGRGITTVMARRLVQLAQEADSRVCLAAQTLPEENASTAVLRQLGFERWGDDEAGEVWEWRLQPKPETHGQ